MGGRGQIGGRVIEQSGGDRAVTIAAHEINQIRRLHLGELEGGGRLGSRFLQRQSPAIANFKFTSRTRSKAKTWVNVRRLRHRTSTLALQKTTMLIGVCGGTKARIIIGMVTDNSRHLRRQALGPGLPRRATLLPGPNSHTHITHTGRGEICFRSPCPRYHPQLGTIPDREVP